MNPELTTNLISSIKNNMLSSADGKAEGLTGDLFADELAAAMKDVLSVDGKFQPSEFATLKEFALKDLEALTGSQLPLEALELEAPSTLNILADEEIDSIDLFGNPDASVLLKTNVIDEDLLEENGLNKQIKKPDTLMAKTISDTTQQTVLNKDGKVSNALDEIDLSQYMKESVKNNSDLASELLTQAGKQEINTTKFVEQLTNIDKPINAINAASNASIKTNANPEPSGTMLNRIEVPVSQAGWGDAVGNRLMMMVNGKMQSANIHLNPAELGPIEIRINVNQEQASVHFVSNNAQVREAIEDAFPRLKEMFAQNGLSLDDTNVSQQSPQQGNQNSREQNDVLTASNNDVLEVVDDQIENTNEKVIDIGLVDQYV